MVFIPRGLGDKPRPFCFTLEPVLLSLLLLSESLYTQEQLSDTLGAGNLVLDEVPIEGVTRVTFESTYIDMF